jgi:D-alanyl-D-alanine endopeptidase (penicillin-binding protein 7)
MKRLMTSCAALLLIVSAHAADQQIGLRWSDGITTPTEHISPAPAQLAYPEAPIALYSQSALVFDQETGEPLFAKNAQMQTPIASITKLMTAILVLEANQDLDERITITRDDRDILKGTGSRLAFGSTYSRAQLLHLALIASDNRAAHALGREYPGGVGHIVQMMNRKAHQLGMLNTVYVEPTGLNSANRSTAIDLARLANYAYKNLPMIRDITTTGSYSLGTQRVVMRKRHHKSQVYYRSIAFNNTNMLTRESNWDIGLSKTGFINEAGHCLVMQARVAHKNVIIVLLDSLGKYSRIGDAARIRRWLESEPQLHAVTSASADKT